jgi:hypothetical protein
MPAPTDGNNIMKASVANNPKPTSKAKKDSKKKKV